MKRTRLNPRSPKHQAENDAARERRAQYLHDFPYCAICRWLVRDLGILPVYKWTLACEVHHLAGRNAKRCDKYEVLENYLSVCRKCHQRITDFAVNTADLCWYAKRHTDADHADLAVLKTLNPRRFRNVK